MLMLNRTEINVVLDILKLLLTDIKLHWQMKKNRNECFLWAIRFILSEGDG